MKINGYIRIAAAILAAIWMFRIFSFSAAPAAVSMQTSRSVSYDIVRSVNDILKLGMDEDKIYGLSRSIEKTVRKLAHMGEFAVLGALIGCACDAWRYAGPGRNPDEPKEKRTGTYRAYLRAIAALLICLVYGATDEFHQTFVDGRSGEVRDVLFDELGALIAIVLIWIVIRYISLRFNRQKTEEVT